MTFFQILAIVFTLAVGVAYLNFRFVKWQPTIALTSASLLLSFLLLIVGHLGYHSAESGLKILLGKIDFYELLVNGLLGFLLFAGALTINLGDLHRRKWEIGSLAFIGTFLSTFLIAGLTFYLLRFVGIPLKFMDCLLFGALISPTDPIAVLAVFKEVDAPKELYVSVAGESLFNDGVAVVIFMTVYGVAHGGISISTSHVITLFLQQAVGGVLYGLALGLLGYYFIKPLTDIKLEIFITLAITTGGYALAQALSISGPLAMVVAGLLIGNRGKSLPMPLGIRKNLDQFWELMDEGLNAVLFLLVGLEIIMIPFTGLQCVIAFLSIFIVLFSRAVSVILPFSFFKLKKHYTPYTVRILIWGGLRGGLAIALALALPQNAARDIILPMTYAVVLFSLIVQGITIKPLTQRAKKYS